jgi:hypothetical protein
LQNNKIISMPSPRCRGGTARRQRGFFTLLFRPGRDNRKLASHNVAGFPHENKIRPERTLESNRYSIVAPRRKYVSNPKPATS